jgi:predicted nucleotide-binding protein
MAMNQDLLAKIGARLGVGSGRVYELVAKKASSSALPRDLAIFLVAADHGVNYQKFATKTELESIRGALGNGINRISTSVPIDAVPIISRPSRAPSPKARSASKPAKDNSVFVVHGRDEGLRRAMFQFLRDIGLQPLEWSKAVLMPPGANPHIDAVLDTAMNKVQAVVVLFSPDDLAYLRPELLGKHEKTTEGKPKGQARPNVIFEAGLALGRHPEKTLLVQVGQVKGFSDIAGKHMVKLSDDATRKKDVAERLRKIGCNVDLRGDDWMSSHGFVPKKN